MTMSNSADTGIQPTSQSQNSGDSPLAPDDGLSSDIQALETEWENRPGKGTFATQDELATWYMGKEHELDEAVATIKLQADAMIRAFERRRDGLRYRWGAEFKAVVDHKLHMQGGKKKSVEFLTGRAGYRSSPERLDIVNPAALIPWCMEHCPSAVEPHIARKTPIKDYIKTTGEVPPGVIFNDKQEQLFPPISRRRLTLTQEPEQGKEREHEA
jgi:hypothetical protein